MSLGRKCTQKIYINCDEKTRFYGWTHTQIFVWLPIFLCQNILWFILFDFILIFFFFILFFVSIIRREHAKTTAWTDNIYTSTIRHFRRFIRQNKISRHFYARGSRCQNRSSRITSSGKEFFTKIYIFCIYFFTKRNWKRIYFSHKNWNNICELQN